MSGNDEDIELGGGRNGYEDKLGDSGKDKAASCDGDGEEDEVTGDGKGKEASGGGQR